MDGNDAGLIGKSQQKVINLYRGKSNSVQPEGNTYTG